MQLVGRTVVGLLYPSCSGIKEECTLPVGAHTQVAPAVGIDRCDDVPHALYLVHLALEWLANIQSVVFGAYIEAVAAYVKLAQGSTFGHLFSYIIRLMLARSGVVAIKHISAGKPYITLAVGLNVAHSVLYRHRGGPNDDAFQVLAIVYMQSLAVANIQHAIMHKHSLCLGDVGKDKPESVVILPQLEHSLVGHDIN